MRFFLLMFAIATASLTADDVLKPISYQFTAPTLKDSPAHADPERTKLTDGVMKPPSRLVWRFRENQNQPVKIDFQFGEPVKLQEVTVHYFRGARSYGIKRINIFSQQEDGSQAPLGGVLLNQPYSLPESQTASLPESETITVDPSRPTERIVVEISGTGGYLGLAEVTFKGEPAAKPTPAAVSAPSVNPYQNLANAEKTGLRLLEKQGYTVLENDFVVYVIDAENGGSVNFAYDKKAGFNFLKYGDRDNFGGMFNDRFWPGSYAVRDSFRGIPYQLKTTADTAERKSVSAAANGKSGIFTNVTIEKIYTLDAASPVLQVHYKVTNDQANVIPLQYGLWIMGGMGTDQDFELIYPGVYRVERIPVKAQSHFAPGSVYGWCAAMRQNGDGVALLCDYELLKTFYFWSNNDRSTTMECRLGVYAIKANESLQTAFALAPFYGVGTPDNLNSAMAGSLGLAPQSDGAQPSATARLLPFRPGAYEVRLLAGKLVRDKVTFTELQTVTVQADGRPVEIPYRLNLTSGTWVVKALVSSHGKEIFEMSASTICEQSGGAYARPPESPKRPESGVEARKLDLNFNSQSYVTPHVKWAKPFAGKKPRVLSISSRKGGIRDMVEMAQRFDIDLTVSYIGGIWRISGLTTTLSENDCYTELAKQLKNKFDAIVVSSRMWRQMPDNVRDAILEQVRDGSGLVLIAPEGLPKDLADSFRLDANPQHFTGNWKATAEHPITSGVPFEALPPTRALPYTAKGGTVLAEIDGRPLLSVFQYGKGRVAAAAWATDGRDRKEYHQTNADPVFLPLMLFNMPENLDHHYWEYQMSLFGKMIYWSADRAGGVTGTQLRAIPGKLTVQLETVEARAVTAELTIRDKFSRPEQQLNRPLQLKPGINAVELDFEVPSMSGLHLADLIIRGESGVEWWGTASFETASPLRIKALKLADGIRKKTDHLTGSVELSAPGEVQVSLFDSYGNEFARSSKPEFDFSLRDCRTLTCRLVAETRRDGKTTDRISRDIVLYGKPDERQLQVIFGWPTLSQRGVQGFLLEHYYRQLMELGANALVTFRTDTPAELLAARRNNLPILGSNSPASSGGKFPFDAKAKINSKFDLIRKPCLSVPGFKDQLARRSNQVTDLEKYGVLFRSGPDEANSVGAWEGCFSPDCQREFREWLKKEYGSLDALNRSWLTSYTDWDQVYALTSEEVKNAPSFAPWVDHRTFNDWNHADAIGHIVKGMKQADPGQRYSLSGTQETNAFNAWDWNRLMKHLDALQSYGGEQAVQQRCFHDGKLIWQTWLGYDRPFNALNQQILNDLMLGATGFSVYSGDFYVNPDYTLPPRALELKKALGLYRNGPAEALMQADFVASPIAFLYSPSSIKVDWITGNADLRLGSVQGYKTWLNGLALNYDYVAPEHLNDAARMAACRILVLPVISALSEQELNDIRRFVQSGGIVIADQMCAVYDGHGKPYAASPLADLFGVRAERLQLIKQPGQLEGLDVEVAGLSLKNLQIPVKSFESGLVPTTARALAQVSADGKQYPAALVNQYGKGLAIYLGCALPNSIADWGEMRYIPKNQESLGLLNQFLNPILKRAAIEPVATVPTLKAATVSARRNGPAFLLGVGRDSAHAANIDPKTQSHTVQLNGEYYIYDLLTGKYLGHGRQFDYEFGPDSQCVFVLLPYRPGKPELQVRRQDGRCHLDIRLDTKTETWADHIFRFELKGPDGKINPAYSELVFGKGGKAEYQFTLPLNAPDGPWTVQVSDVLTGQHNTAEVK
jgi:beta-galactosidase